MVFPRRVRIRQYFFFLRHIRIRRCFFLVVVNESGSVFRLRRIPIRQCFFLVDEFDSVFRRRRCHRIRIPVFIRRGRCRRIRIRPCGFSSSCTNPAVFFLSSSYKNPTLFFHRRRIRIRQCFFRLHRIPIRQCFFLVDESDSVFRHLRILVFIRRRRCFSSL